MVFDHILYVPSFVPKILSTVFHSSKAALSSAFKTHMSVEGATLYTNLLPANTDAQWIADCGIKEIVYLEDQYKQKLFAVAAKKIFDTRGIKCRYSNCSLVTLYFKG